jgi:hypothetical protein
VGLRNLLFSRVDQKAGINQLAIQFARCAYPARKSLFLFLYTANDELSRARLNYSSGIALHSFGVVLVPGRTGIFVAQGPFCAVSAYGMFQ